MAPTTLPEQKTSTSPYGRNVNSDGYPIRMAELLSNLQGVAYSVRVAVNTPKNIAQAAKAVKKAFDVQLKGQGLAFVEVLSACPTNWGMDPLKANLRVAEEMIPYFPLATFKDTGAA